MHFGEGFLYGIKWWALRCFGAPLSVCLTPRRRIIAKKWCHYDLMKISRMLSMLLHSAISSGAIISLYIVDPHDMYRRNSHFGENIFCINDAISLISTFIMRRFIKWLCLDNAALHPWYFINTAYRLIRPVTYLWLDINISIYILMWGIGNDKIITCRSNSTNQSNISKKQLSHCEIISCDMRGVFAIVYIISIKLGLMWFLVACR